MIRRARRVGSLPVLLVALVSVSAWAHYDGTPEEWNPPRHSYYWSTMTTQRDADPETSCTQYCTVSQSRQYYSHWFDGTIDTWKCQCTALSPPGSPGNIFNAGAGNEIHCALGEAFVGSTGGSCTSAGPSACMARKGEYIGYVGFTNPPGFNIPDDETPDGTTFESLKQCSLRRISSSGVGSCWNLTYQVTGSGPVDEDGLTLAQNDGSTWPTGVPSVCDPETEEEDPDGWTGTGGGGGGVIPTEETPELEDPTLGPTADMEEESDSWMDILTEPETWGEEVLAAFSVNTHDWMLFTDSCVGSALNIETPPEMHFGGSWSITCSDTELLRDWLGVACAMLFGWWLINTALTLPKTGG